MRTNSRATIYGMAAAVVAALSLGAWALMIPRPGTQASDPVFSREIVGYEALPAGAGDEAVVKYEYLGEPLPSKLSPDEDVSLRTDTSYTRVLAVEHAGTKEEKRNLQTTFYSQPAFAETGGEWRYIEHATTTKAAFDAARKENALASLFWRTAHAASVAPFPEAGDGQVTDEEVGDVNFETITFLDCFDLAISSSFGSGPYAIPNGTTMTVQSQARTLGGGSCIASIVFLPFNTSSISSGSTITDAVLSVYVTAKTNNINDGTDHLAVYQTSQASTATLDGADHLSYSGTQGSAPTDLSAITTSAYNDFTLNATGLTWVKKAGQSSSCGVSAGYTCLGLIEGHAISGSMPNNATGNLVTMYASEQTGTSNDPYLTVTYIAGASSAFWQFQDF